jgi:hypothetical protein
LPEGGAWIASLPLAMAGSLARQGKKALSATHNALGCIVFINKERGGTALAERRRRQPFTGGLKGLWPRAKPARKARSALRLRGVAGWAR